MRKLTWGILAVAGAAWVTGCSSSTGPDPEHIGQLGLPLATHGPSGEKYRLRDATFEIHHYSYTYSDYGAGGYAAGGGGGYVEQVTTVSSEDDPDAESISLDLEQGDYYVTLDPGWRMEKVDASGAAETVEAQLLSPGTTYVYVYPHSTSWAEYQFGIGSRALWLNGQVNIGIQVYEDPNQYYGGSGGFAGATSWGGEGGATWGTAGATTGGFANGGAGG